MSGLRVGKHDLGICCRIAATAAAVVSTTSTVAATAGFRCWCAVLVLTLLLPGAAWPVLRPIRPPMLFDTVRTPAIFSVSTLPGRQFEHKVYVKPFSDRFPRARVYSCPGQWSWPVNLPPSFRVDGVLCEGQRRRRRFRRVCNASHVDLSPTIFIFRLPSDTCR